MEILEQLTKQAQLLRIKERGDLPWNKKDEVIQCNAVNALFDIHDYLRKIVNRLNQVRPEIKKTYSVFDKYQLNESFQVDYELSLYSKKKVETLELDFWMHSNESKFVFKRKDINNYNNRLSELFSYGLTADENQNKLIKNYSSIDEIELKTDIPVSFVFTASEYSNIINVIVTNFEFLGKSEYQLDNEAITDEFLDHFAKYLIRQEHSFFPDNNVSINISKADARIEIPRELPLSENNITKKIIVNSNFPISRKSEKIFLTYHDNLNELNTRMKPFLIGRDNDSSLIILSEFVSRYHATIIYRNGKFVLIDKSTNGTFIKLQDSNEIYIQQEDYPISGCGLICLGKSITPDNEHLIYFFCA
ncbi:MAG: FHA domain-containing protein [Thiohalomonadales bacterium]